MRRTEFLFFALNLLFKTFSLISVKILSSGVGVKDTADGARDSTSLFFNSSDIVFAREYSGKQLSGLSTWWIPNEMFPL